MPRLKLTERYLAALKPGPGRHWDTEQKGLFVLTLKRGSVFYCKAGGRDFKIGKVDDWTLGEARERCAAIRRAVEKGQDPRPARLPIIEKAFDGFVRIRLAKRGERTREEYRRHMVEHIMPKWGNRPADQLTRADLVRLHAKLTEEGHPFLANRLLATVSSLYGHLQKDLGLDIANPASKIERNREDPRETYLDPVQIARLREALDSHRNKVAADCIHFILATGCRAGEARAALWSQFDPALTVWSKPPSATKQKKVHRTPLSPLAQAILLRRRGLNRRGDPMVFPPAEGKLLDLRRAWRFALKAADLESVRLHDLRHSYASLAISAGVPMRTLGGLLGHSNVRTTARYAHLYEDDLRAAAGKVSAVIEGEGRK